MDICIVSIFMNNAAMNIHVQVLCGRILSVLLGAYLGVGRLVAALYLTITGTAKLFSKMAAPFYNPSSDV